MIGARLVTIAMLYSTSSLQRASFAVIPRTHFSVNARMALLRMRVFPRNCAPARASSR